MAIVTGDVSGWWDFQDGSGSTVTDQSSGAHNATIGAAGSWTTGGPTNLPNGVSLPGSGATNYVTTSFDFDGAGAIAVWVQVNGSTGDQLIMGNGSFGGEFDLWAANTTRRPNARTRYGGADATIASATGLTISTPTFVVYNFDSGSQSIYVDASSVATGTASGTLNDTGNNLVWGQRSTLSGTNLLNGVIFQGIKFNRNLTGTEITDLHNGGAGKTYPQMFSAPANTGNFFAFF